MFIDVDYRALPFVEANLSGIKQLPAARGIYIVATKEGKPLYVGQSGNFATRWPGHHKRRFAEGVGAIIHYLEIPELIDLDDAEQSFIELLKPEWNGKHNELADELGIALDDELVTLNLRVPKSKKRLLAALAKSRHQSMTGCVLSGIEALAAPSTAVASRKSRRPE